MSADQTKAKKKVAILIEQNFEDSEFQIPYTALKAAGAEVTVLGSRVNETYNGKQGKASIKADGTTTEARASDFDAVIIPGGMAPDTMRTNMKTVHFVQDAVEQGKLVAAVCHGPQVLIEGDLLKGKRATGFRAIRKDMQNAGANFVDEPLAVDGQLITSRRPADLPIFTTAILSRLALELEDRELPVESSSEAEWWKLAEEWGGSSKSEIVDAVNTAIRGERYAVTAFEHYAEKVTDAELRSVCKEIRETKLAHIGKLEGRLRALGETESFQAAGSGAWATLKGWLQSNNDLSVLRRALGDLQTGVVDANNLRNSLTDPATAAVLDEIEVDIAKHEQRLADLYHARTGQAPEATQPTTGAAVSA
ncbi:MAG TPA: DJ-1/PfpI/YhbO family deglycase/protease [Pyrinomonadaceae bacterium]|nr:DJ-1/PfpI/YhbO family deglycase/protease [Pyrinomonadaceae bacterium]